ncbi:unnamed protein product [Brassica rapa subsp. trilocularis]
MASFLMFFTIKTLKRALAVVPRKRNGGDPDGNPSSPSIKQKTIKMRRSLDNQGKLCPISTTSAASPNLTAQFFIRPCIDEQATCIKYI